MSVESFKQVMIAQQKTEMAEKQRQEADRQRQEADRQKKVAEEEKVKSEHVTMWTVLLAVIALFVGIAIGSSSKKDATKRRDVHDQ